MGGYDLDEYEDYEDEELEEGGEYEEEEEEEERKPTQEEIEYLELRQKLKESHRKKMKKDSGSGHANSREKKNKLPYDNYGSFFGPSQPVIAQRVIQESKSLLENPHLAERVSRDKHVQNINNKGGSSNPAPSKPRPNGQPQRVDNWAKPKAKIQMLKNTRDYSFLLSDDAQLPVPPKNPPKPVSAPKPDDKDSHLSPRLPANGGRKVINGREERRPPPTSNQTRPKSGQQSQSQRPSSASKMTSTPLDSRKQLGSGPGRPSGQKPAVPSRNPMAASTSKQRVIPPPVSRSSIPGGGHRPPPPPPARSSLPGPTQKRPLEHKRDDRGSQQRRDDNRGYEQRRDDRGFDHRRDDRGPSKGNVIRKPVLPSKPQIKQQPARPPPSTHQKEQRVQKRPKRPFDDEDEDQNAISMIRNMFGYNPNRYRGVNDDDDSDMEAGFDDIMREEKRSAWLAAKEDEEELKKIEEEERRERMRKEAKKRKISQR